MYEIRNIVVVAAVIILVLRLISKCGHQSPSGPSEKCPRTSNAFANCSIMCDNDGCSNSSLTGSGGSQRGRI